MTLSVIYCSFKVMYLLYYYSVLTVVHTDQGKWPVLLKLLVSPKKLGRKG